MELIQTQIYTRWMQITNIEETTSIQKSVLFKTLILKILIKITVNKAQFWKMKTMLLEIQVLLRNRVSTNKK